MHTITESGEMYTINQQWFVHEKKACTHVPLLTQYLTPYSHYLVQLMRTYRVSGGVP